MYNATQRNLCKKILDCIHHILSILDTFLDTYFLYFKYISTLIGNLFLNFVLKSSANSIYPKSRK